MFTLMIVEDEYIEREALRMIISKEFNGKINTIIEAKNGNEAIINAKKHKPDIILMDIGIPEINGLDAHKKIISFLPNVQTIILTAYSNFNYAQEALRLQVKDYLLKPARTSTLKNSINKIISKINKPSLLEDYLYINKSQSDIIRKAIIYMNNNYQNKIDLHSVSNEVHVNSQYLSRLFKKEIGISYVDYLNTVRVNNACNMLSNTTYPAYRIATDSGFTDSAYFSRVFTKHTKLTPSQYRRKNITITNGNAYI